MKHYLAILYSSILFSVCLGFGFIRGDNQGEVESVLQDSSSRLPDDIDFTAISLDDISLIEETAEVKDLTIGDTLKLALLYIKIKTGEYKDSAVEHVLQNQRKYIWGLSAGAIVFLLGSAYYLNHVNHEVDAPKN